MVSQPTPRPTLRAVHTFDGHTWFTAPEGCPACGCSQSAVGNPGGGMAKPGTIASPAVVVYGCTFALSRWPGEVRYQEAHVCEAVTVADLAAAVLERLRAAVPPKLTPEQTSAFASATAAMSVAVEAMRRAFGGAPDGPAAPEDRLLDRR